MECLALASVVSARGHNGLISRWCEYETAQRSSGGRRDRAGLVSQGGKSIRERVGGVTMEPLHAPFPWFGGKSRIAPLVWQRFGDVANYVEPFSGSLAVLLGRPTPPRGETVNDKDALVCNFWRALQADPDGGGSWADWAG